MPERIEGLPNLGPFMARCLAEIDIKDVTTLRNLGAVEVFTKLKFRFGREISLNALWGMDAALSGVRWRQIGEGRKLELRRQLAERAKQSGVTP